MAILAFQKPDKVLMLEASSTFGKFEFRPLEPGYGITIGNALRRILLSSLEGYAFSSVKIEGVDHEFATIPGVMEDMTNIILNLKQVRFKCLGAPLSEEDDEEEEAETEEVEAEKAPEEKEEKKTEGDDEGEEAEEAGEDEVVEEEDEPEALPKVWINVSDTDVLKAGALQPAGFEVLNPEMEICHLAPGTSFQMELTLSKGRGYVPADENRDPSNSDVQVIAIDSIFTPIRNVKYTVENFRVEQKTDYEKLVLEIETDGSIHPKDALREAAKILIHHFMLFSDDRIAVETPEQPGGGGTDEEFDEELARMRQLLKTKLTDMNLSVRALNCLKSANVETVGELVQYNKSDLLKFRNFGKKSLTELDELLDGLELSFGMDITKYKLDKD